MDLDKINQYREKQAEQAETEKEDSKHQEVVGSLNNLLIATMVSKDPKMVEVAKNLSALLEKIGQASASFEGSNLQLLPIANHELAQSVNELAGRIEQYSPHDLKPYFETLNRQINMIAGRTPVVNVPTQPVEVDLKPLLDALKEMRDDVKKNKVDIPKVDFTKVITGLTAVKDTISNLSFPVPNYVLPFKDINGAAVQVQLDADGKVPTSGGASSGGVQYTDGDVDATVTGTAVMWKDSGNVLESVSTTKRLPIASSAVQTQDAAYSPGSLEMVGGVRRDADTSPVTSDGDVQPFIFDELGYMKVSTHPASTAVYTDNITSNGDTVSLDVSRYSNLTIYCSGTFSTVNVAFEGSIDGGTLWFGVQGVRTNANTVEASTGNLSAAPAYAWELSVNALTNFRVRATAFASGTQVWRFQPGTYATEPIPAVQTHAVTGSGNFAVTMASNATTTPAKARDVAAGANDTGIPAFFIRRDTPTTLTPIAGDWEIPQIDSMGSLWVREKSSTTSAVTSVAGSASNVTVLALNAQRRGATIYNDSSAILYLKLGATATTSSFTVKMQPDAYYEVPAQYTGIIDGIWASATGNARVTEISS